ncbi:MAG: flagellar biosynthesis anti-sigma factor FlgM [Propionivibrio sp.]|nr:flagellar biosynthesis anti-sigma factor FlgM [Propionivibrio sp.]
MKIESSTKPLGAGAPLVKEAPGHSSSRTITASSDEVQLSALAAQLSASDDEQAFDAVRVSEIKQAISEGRFTINSGAIAERLIASARELVDSRRQA